VKEAELNGETEGFEEEKFTYQKTFNLKDDP